MNHHNFNPHFIHHQSSKIASTIKEVVFGMEDGMVSTLGAITGIAVGSKNHFTVVLSGLVIIAVESISMGIGSYLSSRSEEEVEERKLLEEQTEIHKFLEEEKSELYKIYLQAGWSPALAQQMVEQASQNPKLMLKEMAYHELNVIPSSSRGSFKASLRGGMYMFLFYVLGGLIPLIAYFFLPVATAIKTSVVITLLGLFTLGVGTTKYTKRSWLKSGLHMLALGSVALAVGYFVGKFAGQLKIV